VVVQELIMLGGPNGPDGQEDKEPPF
jgi:hypothetical protein